LVEEAETGEGGQAEGPELLFEIFFGKERERGRCVSEGGTEYDVMA
jgi:hypothetical protein